MISGRTRFGNGTGGGIVRTDCAAAGVRPTGAGASGAALRSSPGGVRPFVRLPAEPVGWRKALGDARGDGLRLHRFPKLRGSGHLQHLRGPGKRRGPGVRQRGRPEKGQARPPGHADRALRLYDAAAGGRGTDSCELPLRRPRVRHPRAAHAARAALPAAFGGAAAVFGGAGGRGDHRGAAAAQGRRHQGEPADHVRVRQLLYLLHCALCARPGGFPHAGAH